MVNIKNSPNDLPPTANSQQPIIGLSLGMNRWIRAEAKDRDWRLLHLWYHNKKLPRYKLKGALIRDLPNSDIVVNLLKNKCKVVRLGNYPHPNDEKVLAILPDNTAAGHMAAEHFAQRGFNDVAFFANKPWSDAEILFESFNKKSNKLGMTVHLYQQSQKNKDISKELHLKRKQKEFQVWIKNIPKPVGLLAPGAWFAATYSSWIEEIGLNIPSEVAILSYGNKEDVCECSIPSISYIEINEEGLVHTACESLTKLIIGKQVPKKAIYVKSKKLVTLESTNMLATSDPLVAKTLKYMWENLHVQLSVEDIAKKVNLSSRHLERRFKKALGRTINVEYRRKRLEETKHLLLTSRLTIAEISKTIGFNSTAYLHRTFLKEFKISPAQYRNNRKSKIQKHTST